MKTISPKIAILFLIILFSFTLAKENIAVVVKLKGEVRITPANSTRSALLKKGHILEDGDKIETLTSSFCAIKFLDDKSLLRIKENSVCTIEGKRKGNAIEKNLFAEVGAFFLSLFQQKENFTVTTPTSVASVKGTKFWTLQFKQSGESRYVCTDGSVEVKNGAGKVLIKQGQTCVVYSRSRMPEVRLTREGDIPSDETGEPTLRELDVEFGNAENQNKILRIKIKTQE